LQLLTSEKTSARLLTHTGIAPHRDTDNGNQPGNGNQQRNHNCKVWALNNKRPICYYPGIRSSSSTITAFYIDVSAYFEYAIG